MIVRRNTIAKMLASHADTSTGSNPHVACPKDAVSRLVKSYV